ncbi:MAG TPA: hypothetical protein VGF92_05470 [Stellaceae bacterium]|jgi:hypothetical protein
MADETEEKKSPLAARIAALEDGFQKLEKLVMSHHVKFNWPEEATDGEAKA